MMVCYGPRMRFQKNAPTATAKTYSSNQRMDDVTTERAIPRLVERETDSPTQDPKAAGGGPAGSAASQSCGKCCQWVHSSTKEEQKRRCGTNGSDIASGGEQQNGEEDGEDEVGCSEYHKDEARREYHTIEKHAVETIVERRRKCKFIHRPACMDACRYVLMYRRGTEIVCDDRGSPPPRESSAMDVERRLPLGAKDGRVRYVPAEGFNGKLLDRHQGKIESTLARILHPSPPLWRPKFGYPIYPGLMGSRLASRHTISTLHCLCPKILTGCKTRKKWFIVMWMFLQLEKRASFDSMHSGCAAMQA